MPIIKTYVMLNRLAKVGGAFLRLFFKRAEHLPGTGKGKEKVSEADLKKAVSFKFGYLCNRYQTMRLAITSANL